MIICNRCILPSTFPGITFDNDGVCNHCLDFKGEKALNEEKAEYYAKFQELIKQAKGTADYDCTLSYSGGKDSTYTLYYILPCARENKIDFSQVCSIMNLTKAQDNQNHIPPVLKN